MRRPFGSLALSVSAAVAVAGCGAGDGEPLPSACLEGQATVVRALQAAPDPVALADGTRLSTCVDRARDDSDLQAVGLIWSGAAEQLVREDEPVALGYLLGATRRGAERTTGIALELVRRIESSARRLSDLAALRRGVRAGEATG